MYIPERDLLKLLLSKDCYTQYSPYIDRKYIKDNYRELSYVYTTLDELHTINHGDITVEELQAYFFHKYPESDKTIYLNLFNIVKETELSNGVGRSILDGIRNRKLSLALSEAAFKYSTGVGTLDAVNTAITELTAGDTVEEVVDEFVSDDLEAILNKTIHGHGLRWRLDFLNKSLGSLRKGTFGFIFARPETGKTTFLASEVSEMLRNLPDDAGPVLWVNNEQEGEAVMIRVYQAYFGLRLDQFYANPKKWRDQFRQETKGRFKLYDNANTERGKVETLCKVLRPSLIIFDQIDKIKGFVNDREDLRLGAIYIWARELAKLYCPVIGVCQADGTAEGQKWLTMDNVANAKTSKQAEADWILGIGATHNRETQFTRYLNISKNKCMGDSDSIEQLRHGQTEVLIEPTIGRYKDIVKYG